MDPIVQFLDSWREMLALPGNPPNREVDIDSTYRCVYESDHGQPVFFIVVPERPKPIDIASAVEVEIGQRSDDKWTLAFRCTEPTLRDTFMVFCEQIAWAAMDATTDRQLRRRIKAVADDWRHMLARAGRLSDDQLRGLMAELFILDILLSEGQVPPSEIVDAWEGPEQRPKDFIGSDGWAREVKAISKQGASVEIHGDAQLDTDGLDSLLLDVVTTTVGGNGLTLAEAAERITGRLDEESGRVFERKLRRIEPKYDDAASDERRVVIQRHRSFTIDEGFPRLTPQSVPLGVTNVKYSVQIKQLSPSSDTVIRKGTPWNP